MKSLFRLLRNALPLAVALSTLIPDAHGASFSFTTDPFDGTTALTTPGRQVVGGEPFITFSTATDVFAFDPAIFGIGGIQFVNNVITSVPTTGVNTIVLRTFDNDSDPATAFGAGIAANLLADRITIDGPGFFIYFNSGLDLPRLVYSANLSDNTADLKVLARLTNFTGQPGRDAMAGFTAANFQTVSAPVPEPGSNLVLVMAGAALVMMRRILRRQRSGRESTA